MTEKLHELLEGDAPVALRRIERALRSSDVRNETVDSILTALIWRRCTTGREGILGAFLNWDCAARISVLALHLDRVGASKAAQAVRDLRRAIPLPDKQIRGGLIDWVDANPKIALHARKLDEGIDDVAPQVWDFMQRRQNELPNPEIPDKKQSLFARIFAGRSANAERPV